LLFLQVFLVFTFALPVLFHFPVLSWWDVRTCIVLDRWDPKLVRSYVVSFWTGHHDEERTDAPQPGFRWRR
jgi:hypothetical protein